MGSFRETLILEEWQLVHVLKPNRSFLQLVSFTFPSTSRSVLSPAPYTPHFFLTLPLPCGPCKAVLPLVSLTCLDASTTEHLWPLFLVCGLEVIPRRVRGKKQNIRVATNVKRLALSVPKLQSSGTSRHTRCTVVLPTNPLSKRIAPRASVSELRAKRLPEQ